MKTNFANGISMNPGHITLIIKGGVCEYKVYGYAIAEIRNGISYIDLQPADRRCSPVASFRRDMIASLTCEF